MNPEHESFLVFPPAAHGERKEFCGSHLAAAVCRPHSGNITNVFLPSLCTVQEKKEKKKEGQKAMC